MTNGADNAMRTETFDWQNEDNSTCDLPDQRNGILGAVSVLIEDRHYTCGGEYPYTDKCFNSITGKNAPFDLLHKRSFASSVSTNDTVFVFGGSNGSNELASYETISVDKAQSEGVLPFTWVAGCSTLTNSTVVMLAGGLQDGTLTSKTWLFNFKTEEWTQGPSMIKERLDFGCGFIKSIQSVVVFGGLPSTASTEIVQFPGGSFKQGNRYCLFELKRVSILFFLQLMICPLNLME